MLAEAPSSLRQPVPQAVFLALSSQSPTGLLPVGADPDFRNGVDCGRSAFGSGEAIAA
jgi:hypothetical protein